APPLDLDRRDHQVRPCRRIDLRGELEIPPVEVPAQPEPARRRDGVERLLGERAALNVGRSANGVRANADADTSARKKAEEAEAKRKAEEAEARKKKEDEERDAELAAYYQQQWANEEDGVADGVQGEETAPLNRPSGLRCGVSENPGWALLVFYGIQHYLSIAGSLVFIPLILVPTMGGSDVDTATVISTMLLVSGLTTILHTFLGSRLPLIQGSSFVYLAPALVIANSEEFRNLSEDKFKHIMRELQGAILVGSVFQIILGYSGLMSLLLRYVKKVIMKLPA
uniref:Nucleobase-ascorbate transporter 11 n=1 Tax=Aegilops tauschii subsp. strangulata TaxID=200361 RepID=A0A453BIJ9_AEGTS